MKTLKVFGMIIIIKWLITAVAVTHFVSHSRSSVMKRTPPSYVALADNTGIHQFYDVYLISSLERKEDLRWLPDDREFLLPAGGNLCHTCGE
ncbi:MAG TPA: hypothetical protein VNJ07_00880, partial [Chitinophagales bacterium]|nr:hypothetical protein [Chitinophagales bacterium]